MILKVKDNGPGIAHCQKYIRKEVSRKYQSQQYRFWNRVCNQYSYKERVIWYVLTVSTMLYLFFLSIWELEFGVMIKAKAELES